MGRLNPFVATIALAMAAWVLILGGPVLAHDMPKSAVQVRVLAKAWRLHLRLPADRLEVAFVQAGLASAPKGDARLKLSPDAVTAYVTDRIKARSPDGAAWGVRVLGVTESKTPTDEWSIEVELTPPPGPPPSSVMLNYEVIVREIATHEAVVTLEQDWDRNILPQHPRLVGALRAETRSLQVQRADPPAWPAWISMVWLGARHILEGADHLLFLTTLILTAPLQAEGRRWRPVADGRRALGATFARVSAFTAGHSASLLAASLGWLPPSGRGIEALIALSVGVSALHALRPIFPRREAWVAGGFGLVHGMAFAGAISALSLTTGQIIAATLGFNLGIELVQIVLVCVLAPLFFAIRAKAIGDWVRWGLGGGALIASAIWLFTRLM